MNDSLPNDRDRELAAWLADPSRALPEGESGFVDALRAYRGDYQGTPVDDRAGARMWAGIERATRPGADRNTVRRVRTMRLVWSSVAVAAAIVVLVLVPRVLTPAEAQLVAEALDQRLVYTTEDGSTVTLRPNSRLFLNDDAYRLEGEAFFDVVHDPSRHFRVTTMSGTVEVLGTRFNVEAAGEETTVYLEEGSVRFLAGSAQHVLEPGQTVRSVSGSIGEPAASSGSEETDWLRGELVFESRTAGQVANELGRHFDVRIEIPQGRRDESLSGRILLEEKDRALEDFALVLGGRFIPTGEGLRFISN